MSVPINTALRAAEAVLEPIWCDVPAAEGRHARRGARRSVAAGYVARHRIAGDSAGGVLSAFVGLDTARRHAV